MPIIVLSLWESIGAFDPASAESREKFAAKLAGWREAAIASRRESQVRTGHYVASDLRAQDNDRFGDSYEARADGNEIVAVMGDNGISVVGPIGTKFVRDWADAIKFANENKAA